MFAIRIRSDPLKCSRSSKTWLLSLAVISSYGTACATASSTSMCTYAGLEGIPASSPNCVAPPPPPPPPPMVVARVPQFPWPAPKPTTHTPIPRALLQNPATASETLGDIADRVEIALRAAGLDYAAYGIGNSGFAYVTRVEMIRPDGTPFPPPNRFPTDVRTSAPNERFLDFVVSRFFARPGFYRVIAIVVTDRPLITSSTGITADSATSLADGTMISIPPELRGLVVPRLGFAALIYEYSKANAAQTTADLRTSPLISAHRHLAKAGIWSLAALGGNP
jgi:hypothetical protein